METTSSFEVAQWAIAAGGWIVAIITLALDFIDRRGAREEERLSRTLEYFDGGSQRRSVGIALIEGIWIKKPRYLSIIVPLVANQIVYLLLSTDSHDAHNERNLVRLFMVFKSIPDVRSRYSDRCHDVVDAIVRKVDGEPKGIPMSDATLKIWARDLGHDMAA
jgi:hypothetical protein